MTDTQECYIAQNKAKFEKSNRLSEDKRDEASFKEEEPAIVNKNTDIERLKEHNLFIDDNGINIYSNLYGKKYYANRDFTSSKKDKPLSDLNDIRQVCEEFTNDKNEGTSVVLNRRLFYSKENNMNSQNISSETNDMFISSKECQPKELNGESKPIDMKVPSSNMPDSNEIVYYAVHIPNDFASPDVSMELKDDPLVYTDKEEVLKVIKLNKKARFKQFKSKKEAEEFALNGAEISQQEGSSAIADNEKVMPFKRPKTEEMIQFRKYIERGDIDAVREKIFENPKYLISNGDTPSILQEGSRYNALHVAAKAKNAKITQLILDSITCIDFIRYLYDDNDIESCISRSEILIDRYLNTPDKGSNETPLHLAVKHGAVDVVKVLLSYSQCQKNDIYNRYNELPKDIICSRVLGPCEEAKAAIASMLDEQYFVPVLRSEDNSIQPKVGDAFSLSNPLKVESDLLSPRLEIQAYAGPMTKEKAELFKKKWKVPIKSIKDSSFSSRLRDAEKGLEKTGRNLATELQVPWQEYWSFLDTFVNISSQQGLQLLENYLKQRFQEAFENMKKGKDLNSSEDSNEKSFCSISDLCETFELCGPQDKQSHCSTPRQKHNLSLSPGVNQREPLCKKPNESNKNYGKNPLVYVERSCEVFGKRIGAAIRSCVLYDNHAESLKESLETQIKHLLGLVKSYKEDTRFQSVDFQLIHSRVAAIAIQSLQNVMKRDKQLILTALKEIDWSDGALSDDEDFNYKNYNNNEWLGITTKQLHCFVKHLILQLMDFQESFLQLSPSALDEGDCQMLWAFATPCGCTWGLGTSKRGRGGLKRKQFRNDCDCDVSPRKIHFEFDKVIEEISETMNTETINEDNEDHFSTPTSGNSDSEDMEDVMEIPNTFIYPGSVPTKMDYAVLEAIDKVPLSSDKYPNIYLWRHILQMQPKNLLVDHHFSTPEALHRKVLNFNSPRSSPRNLMEKSFSGCESPSMYIPAIEQWERVTGSYSPRRSTCSSLTMPTCESPIR